MQATILRMFTSFKAINCAFLLGAGTHELTKVFNSVQRYYATPRRKQRTNIEFLTQFRCFSAPPGGTWNFKADFLGINHRAQATSSVFVRRARLTREADIFQSWPFPIAPLLHKSRGRPEIINWIAFAAEGASTHTKRRQTHTHVALSDPSLSVSKLN